MQDKGEKYNYKYNCQFTQHLLGVIIFWEIQLQIQLSKHSVQLQHLSGVIKANNWATEPPASLMTQLREMDRSAQQGTIKIMFSTNWDFFELKKKNK